MAKVLLVDDELTVIQGVGELLRSEGHQVLPFTNTRAAIDAIPASAPDLIVAHVVRDRTRTAAPELLHKARAITPPALVIMLTAEAMGTALEAMRHGAYDYLQKPFTPEELKLRVQRALAYQAAVFENASLRKQLQSNSHFQEIIAVSPRMQEILPVLDRAANSDGPVLILGPGGSGKEFIARALHFQSRRRFAPFLTLSCSALPTHLVETELFGERKTIFHSCIEEKLGLVREANGGTIFLREIGALPLAVQNRLLDLLEGRPWADQETNTVGIDVRVIAAADQAKDVEPQHGKFMIRLHERLAGMSLTLPALRDRIEDLPVLVAHFLKERHRARQARSYSISAEALELCARYSWPGNVRELQVALEHACAVNQDGVIQIGDLPRTLQQLRSTAPSHTHSASREQREFVPPPTNAVLASMQDALTAGAAKLGSFELVPLKKFLRDQEIGYLQRTLAEVGGSKERAAELLGISLATIYRKLAEPAGLGSPDSGIGQELEETVAGSVPAV